MSILRRCVAIAAIGFVALTARAAEVIPPKPDGYFNDYAGVVSKEAASRFNEQLAEFERETSNQVVVAVFPKMQSDDDAAAYGQRIAESWQVGQKDKRNGVVLFVFIADHKASIQVGYGLEGALPDFTTFDIRENRINPHFRKGDYEGGFADGIDSILKAIRGEYKGTGKTGRERESNIAKKIGLFLLNHPILIILLIVFFMPRLKPRKGYHYSSSGSGWGWAFSGGGSGGGWSSGGGGGGGFSGFSGGGGSFGGGGSSGSW